VPFTQNDGVTLHWQEKGEGTPLLLIMGHRFSSEMWYPILPALTQAHRTIWFDNRGAGQSSYTRKLTVAQMAADAFAVMDAAGVEKAHVFGVSMGGGVALEMAVRQPARLTSLVLGCTAAFTAEKRRMPSILRNLYYLPNWALRIIMSGGRGDHGYGSAAPLDRVAIDQKMVASDKFSRPGVIAQAVAVASHITTLEAVAGVTTPTLVLHGDEDGLVPFHWGEELAMTIPGSRLVKLEGAGHNFLVAGLEKATAEVLYFFAEVDARRGSLERA
jgi:pimeloyl-ACP methyl ester carboxylesterase